MSVAILDTRVTPDPDPSFTSMILAESDPAAFELFDAQPEIEVFVNGLGSIPIQAFPDETVLDLKLRLKARGLTALNRSVLVLGDRELQDDVSVGSLAVLSDARDTRDARDARSDKLHLLLRLSDIQELSIATDTRRISLGNQGQGLLALEAPPSAPSAAAAAAAEADLDRSLTFPQLTDGTRDENREDTPPANGAALGGAYGAARGAAARGLAPLAPVCVPVSPPRPISSPSIDVEAQHNLSPGNYEGCVLEVTDCPTPKLVLRSAAASPLPSPTPTQGAPSLPVPLPAPLPPASDGPNWPALPNKTPAGRVLHLAISRSTKVAFTRAGDVLELRISAADTPRTLGSKLRRAFHGPPPSGSTTPPSAPASASTSPPNAPPPLGLPPTTPKGGPSRAASLPGGGPNALIGQHRHGLATGHASHAITAPAGGSHGQHGRGAAAAAGGSGGGGAGAAASSLSARRSSLSVLASSPDLHRLSLTPGTPTGSSGVGHSIGLSLAAANAARHGAAAHGQAHQAVARSAGGPAAGFVPVQGPNGLWSAPASPTRPYGAGEGGSAAVGVGMLHRHLLEAQAGLATGFGPQLVEEGTGGTYVLRGPTGVPVGIFKPSDEEPFGPANPKGYAADGPDVLEGAGGMGGEEGLRRGLRPGEGAVREVAAFLLDHGHNAGVPPTALVEVEVALDSHPHPPPLPPTPPGVVVKRGSLQEFIEGAESCEDRGTAGFHPMEVKKIAILDLRLGNTDRNAGNILARPHPSPHGSGPVLVPIDHAYTLPASFQDLNYEWRYWRQAEVPFSPSELSYIAALDADRDLALLKENGIDLRPECRRVFKVCTLVLKRCAAAGRSAAQIADVACRTASSSMSVLEQMSSQAVQLALSDGLRTRVQYRGAALSDNGATQAPLFATVDEAAYLMHLGRILDEFLAE